MKDKVVLGPTGLLAIAIPLFRLEYTDIVDKYHISFCQIGPVAYILEFENDTELVSAAFLEKHVEFLGDL